MTSFRWENIFLEWFLRIFERVFWVLKSFWVPESVHRRSSFNFWWVCLWCMLSILIMVCLVFGKVCPPSPPPISRARHDPDSVVIISVTRIFTTPLSFTPPHHFPYLLHTPNLSSPLFKLWDQAYCIHDPHPPLPRLEEGQRFPFQISTSQGSSEWFLNLNK